MCKEKIPPTSKALVRTGFTQAHSTSLPPTQMKDPTIWNYQILRISLLISWLAYEVECKMINLAAPTRFCLAEQKPRYHQLHYNKRSRPAGSMAERLTTNQEVPGYKYLFNLNEVGRFKLFFPSLISFWLYLAFFSVKKSSLVHHHTVYPANVVLVP